jgi:hypothetical protein
MPLGLPNDGTRILNRDLAEKTGSAALWVELRAPAQRASPSATSKSLRIRWRDLSALEEANPAVSVKSGS